MAVRIKDGEIPYTGGIGIEITNNHVINVLLRKLNNLIHVNENRELYVDLQLDDGIQPDDDFPVGVTTGRILQEDGWPQSGLIINRKTTSGDYSRLITASDGNLYVDLGDGVWHLLGGEGIDCNVRRFLVTDLQGDTEVGQQMVNWYLEGKYPIIVYRGESYILEAKPMSNQLRFYDIHSTVMHVLNQGYSYSYRNALYATWDVNNEFQGWLLDEVQISPSVLATDIEYQTPYVPQYPGSPTTKNYVDTELLKKQDLLTPGTRITIQTDPNTGDLVISADVSGVMTYMGNVTDASQLPTTGQNQGDCWYSELEKTLYAWDGTQWNDIGGPGIDLTNYFNMQVNDSDDIIEGSTHLFVTQTEKNTWNGKQNPIRAGQNISIDSDGVTINAIDTKYTAGDGININVNNVISNTAKFDPSNAGSMGQFLKKTNDGYQWADIPGGGGTSYTAGDGININNSNVISNTKPFDPSNTGTIGQVLKRNSSGYHWADESGGGGGGGGNFEPDNIGTEGQVLTREGGGYRWMNIELPSGENNVKFWTINSYTVGSTLLQEIYEWINTDDNNGAIINDTYTNDVYVYNKIDNSGPTPKAVFFGVKRNSAIREWTSGNVSHGYYTVQWQTELDIITGPSYGVMVRENPDDDTHTNYISALGANYPSPFMPTEGTQPATKAYVDSLVPGGASAITNNTTGTTYTISQEWVGTQAQYNAITPVNGVIYNIIPSS